VLDLGIVEELAELASLLGIVISRRVHGDMIVCRGISGVTCRLKEPLKIEWTYVMPNQFVVDKVELKLLSGQPEASRNSIWRRVDP
jgi:hypothetical protein